MLHGITLDTPSPNPTVPMFVFVVFQMTFAIVTPALITGAFKVTQVRVDDAHEAAGLDDALIALSEALLTKGPYLQHVWGLDPSGRLDRDPSAPDASDDGDVPASQWWLRVERQTTLPLGDRALFVIRPYLVPLVALDGRQRSVLAAAVSSMSPASVAYKGITDVRDELLGWLQLSDGSSG